MLNGFNEGVTVKTDNCRKRRYREGQNSGPAGPFSFPDTIVSHSQRGNDGIWERECGSRSYLERPIQHLFPLGQEGHRTCSSSVLTRVLPNPVREEMQQRQRVCASVRSRMKTTEHSRMELCSDFLLI